MKTILKTLQRILQEKSNMIIRFLPIISLRYAFGLALSTVFWAAMIPPSQAHEEYLSADELLASPFAQITEHAEGQSVNFHAWGGSAQYNAFIAWVAKRVAEEYDVNLIHVPISDTALAVRQVLAEKQANTEYGSIDLIWINGQNFQAMKQADLLFGGYFAHLPNAALIDTQKNSAVIEDFGVPTDGMESPWGMARLNFGYDQARLLKPPRSAEQFLAYAQSNQGRLTYSAVPDFTGMAFLKQVLLELSGNDSRLYARAKSADIVTLLQVLWDYLDQLHPLLWREGKDFPAHETGLIDLLNNNAIDVMFSYNIGAVRSAIIRGDLPETARSYVFDAGTLGNVNFVAMPFNASSPEGALVVANFLMSPEAQARRQNPEIWGDLSVLDYARLDAQSQTLFDQLPSHPASLTSAELGRTLPEPHPSWTKAIEKAWLERYGS